MLDEGNISYSAVYMILWTSATHCNHAAMLAVTQPLSDHLNIKLYNESREQVANQWFEVQLQELLDIS